MVEPEVAFLELPGLLELAEEFVSYVVGRALDRCREELKFLERDTAKLENVRAPFPRLRYDEAAAILTAPGRAGADAGGRRPAVRARERLRRLRRDAADRSGSTGR